MIDLVRATRMEVLKLRRTLARMGRAYSFGTRSG